MTDDVLANQVQQGNRDAFAALVDRHQDRVYRTLFQMVGSEQDAQDLAQEVFLKVHRFLPGFNGQAAFSTWLHRLTVNVALDWLRLRRRRPWQVSLDPPPGSDTSSATGLVAVDGNAEAVALRHEQSESLRQALQSLPPPYREVLLLRHLHHLPYDQIAERIRAPVRTVETRLYRARVLLRKALAEQEGGDSREVSSRAATAERIPGR